MEILDKLNIKTDNLSIYETALTHTSYANENNCESYERLEYLGDAVLELIVSDYLYNTGAYSEGEMTKVRAHYVCGSANYEYAMNFGLNKYLRLGHGESEDGGKFKKAIVADIYESFLGAIYLDQGFEKAREFVHLTAIPYIKENKLKTVNDYKSKLQELIQTEKGSIEYKIIKEEGPSHDKTFTAIVKVDDIIYGEGIAGSKKEAEQMAAKVALEKSVSKVA